MNRTRLTCLTALLLVAVASTGTNNACAADKVGARNAQPDHPLGVVAFASVDRLKGRAESLANALGRAGEGEKFLADMMGGDEGLLMLIRSKGLDTTRPIGAMCYPKWLGTPDDAEKDAGFEFEDLFDDFASTGLEACAKIFVEKATLVICIPYKDRKQLLDDVAADFGGEEGLKPVDDQPGWYHVGGNAELRIGFAHNYLLLVQDDGEVKQFDRNYPDFAKLARSSLGKNGFVYALYRKGLPFLVRDVMGPALKMAFAARFQQQDEESELQFRLRTMSSALQMQLLDLAISHVDEFRITGHVDSATRTIFIEPEIIGAKGGKLAKFFNDGKATSNLFANQPTDDAIIAASMSLPLPAKDWKPTVDALYAFAQAQQKSGWSDIVRTYAKTIESGQFELYTYHPSWKEGLIALRHGGGARFPEQLTEALAKLVGPNAFELEFDAVDGIPIHRTLTSLDGTPTFYMLALPLFGLFGQEFPMFELGESAGEKEVVSNTLNEVVEADGTKRVVAKETRGTVQTGQDCLWLATTPRAIFVGLGSSKTSECPDWFKTQVAASLQPSSSRNKSSFQVTLRQLGVPPDAEIQQAADVASQEKAAKVQQVGGKAGDAAKAELANKTQANEQARANLIRDLPNAIRCEFRPTETGAKLSIALEEAYFQWFATMIRDSQEEQQIRDTLQPENLQVAPGSSTLPGQP